MEEQQNIQTQQAKEKKGLLKNILKKFREDGFFFNLCVVGIVR